MHLMKYRFILCILLLIGTLNLQAQQQNKKVHAITTPRQLKAENLVLKNRIDSLMLVLDSVKVKQLQAEQLNAEMLAAKEVVEHKNVERTQEQTDSLLALWYKSYTTNLNADLDVVNRYDMSVETFSSDVPDSVMIRRLAEMNAFITLPFNPTVKNYMILYSEKMAPAMSRVMGLAKYYFPIFEEILARYEMPLELKYMAVIESFLNPIATSRAGARGMWQFMYRTGRNYGLNIDSFVDDRLDVEKAADAAARYLRDAYNIFGDWCLAISSYNCGPGNVSKAIRRADGKRDFWSIYDFLPRETRGYMPAFVGAMYAMTYNREYGIEPMDVGMPAQTDTFIIRRKLHFQQINEVVGVPMDDLHQFNPQYTHDIIPGSEKAPCVINLPYYWTGPFLDANQDSLYLHRSKQLLSDEVIKAVETRSSDRIAYKVKNGDYLGKIASKYHVSVSQLKKWNHLRSDKLRIGQVLYIYR